MKVWTPFGEQVDPPRERIEQDLDGLQRVLDEDVFVGIARPDGTFLQMRRLPIEFGDGTGRVRRATLPPDVRRMFLAFAEGREDWAQGIEWIDDPEPRRLLRSVRWWVAWAAVLMVLAALAAYLWLRTR